MQSLHGRKCHGHRVYVTPIVAASPSKSNDASETLKVSAEPLPPNEPPSPPPPPIAGSLNSFKVNLKLKTTRNLAPTSTKFYDQPIVIIDENPTSADKVKTSSFCLSSTENNTSSVCPPSSNSNLSRRKSVSEKRKPLESPEKNDQVKGLNSNSISRRKLRKKGSQSELKEKKSKSWEIVLSNIESVLALFIADVIFMSDFVQKDRKIVLRKVYLAEK